MKTTKVLHSVLAGILIITLACIGQIKTPKEETAIKVIPRPRLNSGIRGVVVASTFHPDVPVYWVDSCMILIRGEEYGKEIAKVSTGQEGEPFEIRLPPGDYWVHPEDLPRNTMKITVTKGKVVEMVLDGD